MEWPYVASLLFAVPVTVAAAAVIVHRKLQNARSTDVVQKSEDSVVSGGLPTGASQRQESPGESQHSDSTLRHRKKPVKQRVTADSYIGTVGESERSGIPVTNSDDFPPIPESKALTTEEASTRETNARADEKPDAPLKSAENADVPV